MTNVTSRWDLGQIEISKSGKDAALSVVHRLSQERKELAAQWSTALRLAEANGASLREIGSAAGVSPQTVANVCKSSG